MSRRRSFVIGFYILLLLSGCVRIGVDDEFVAVDRVGLKNPIAKVMQARGDHRVFFRFSQSQFGEFGDHNLLSLPSHMDIDVINLADNTLIPFRRNDTSMAPAPNSSVFALNFNSEESSVVLIKLKFPPNYSGPTEFELLVEMSAEQSDGYYMGREIWKVVLLIALTVITVGIFLSGAVALLFRMRHKKREGKP